MLKLLTSVHAGKIDDLHKNVKSYNIKNHFFLKNEWFYPGLIILQVKFEFFIQIFQNTNLPEHAHASL